jgi:hypothetical protein
MPEEDHTGDLVSIPFGAFINTLLGGVAGWYDSIGHAADVMLAELSVERPRNHDKAVRALATAAEVLDAADKVLPLECR